MSIIVKSGVPGKVPTSNQLDYGQLAINYADQRIYYKNSVNQIVQYGVGLTGDQNIAGVKTFTSVTKFTANYIDLEGGSPSIVFKDSDNLTAYIHVNANFMYFLRGVNGAGYGAWTQVNSQWPMILNLSTNDCAIGGSLTAVGNIIAYSDARLKSNLVQISEAINKVSQLTGYTYTRKDNGQRQTGLIAQDVQKVLPEAVTENQEGILGISYGNLAGLIVEAIKELDIRIQTLERKIDGS